MPEMYPTEALREMAQANAHQRLPEPPTEDILYEAREDLIQTLYIRVAELERMGAPEVAGHHRRVCRVFEAANRRLARRRRTTRTGGVTAE